MHGFFDAAIQLVTKPQCNDRHAAGGPCSLGCLFRVQNPSHRKIFPELGRSWWDCVTFGLEHASWEKHALTVKGVVSNRYDIDGTIASMWNSQREYEGLELSDLCGCGACTPCLQGEEHRHHMNLLAKHRARTGALQP